MRIKGRKTTKRKVIYYACDRCGNYKAIGETREAMAERSPICQKCGAKNMIRREYKNGKKVFQCKKCGRKTLMPIMDKKKLVIEEGYKVTMVKLIKADIDKLPAPIKMAVITLSQYWIERALNYNGKDIPCPYCGSWRVVKKGKKKWRSGRIVQKYLCKDCGREFTPNTYIRLAAKERMPPCPECGSNEAVVKHGHDYKGDQHYYCKKCRRKFLPRVGRVKESDAKKALDYVSGGKSLERISKDEKRSKGSIIKSVRALGNDTDCRIIENARLSGIVIADEKKVFVCGRQMYLWGFLDFNSRFCVYSDVTPGRGWRDAARGLLAYYANSNISALVSDGHPCYSRALVYLFAPYVVFVFWNRIPGKSFPLDFKRSAIIIDDFGDHAVVSIGLDRAVPLGVFPCRSEEDLASIISNFSSELAVIIVNTKRNLSRVVLDIVGRRSRFIYHFICGYGYLKAYVERFFASISRRLSLFDSRFMSLEGARSFSKLYAFDYNWLREHRSLGARPAEVVLGERLPDDEIDVLRLVISLPRLNLDSVMRKLGFKSNIKKMSHFARFAVILPILYGIQAFAS